MDLNEARLEGHVGRFPDFYQTKEGTMARFSMATNYSYKKINKAVTKTVWHKIVVFNPKLVEIVKNYVSAGTEIYITGYIDNSTYTDEKNITRTNSVIVALKLNIISLKRIIDQNPSSFDAIAIKEEFDSYNFDGSTQNLPYPS